MGVKFNLTVVSYDAQFGTYSVVLSGGSAGWTKKTLIPEEVIGMVIGSPDTFSIISKTFTIENPYIPEVV